MCEKSKTLSKKLSTFFVVLEMALIHTAESKSTSLLAIKKVCLFFVYSASVIIDYYCRDEFVMSMKFVVMLYTG